MDIQSQIDFLKISGSVLPPGSAEEIADTMQLMSAVCEAAKLVAKSDLEMCLITDANCLDRMKQALADLEKSSVA